MVGVGGRCTADEQAKGPGADARQQVPDCGERVTVDRICGTIVDNFVKDRQDGEPSTAIEEIHGC
ncbi:hypothetical protein GCM10022416_52340 [Actinomadura keratinilytica]|uniref:Uncharacterized protein n=1 Tax=Actinomadura keratinilytica TaxID=547461 RepID=A0ABP7ZCJ4_9ACTN